MYMTTVSRFVVSSAVEQMHAAIRRDGALIIESVLSQAEVADLNQRFQSALDEEKRLQQGRGDLGGYMPSTMVFATNLPARFPEIARHFSHPLILELVTAALGTDLPEITINTTQVMESWPGNPAQPLHRDDVTWPLPAPRPELTVVTLWALQNFTAEAGGTNVIPGSHLWQDARLTPQYDADGHPAYKCDPRPDELQRIEMEPGSVLVFLGSLVHGGGNNTSDRVRRFMHIGYCHSWLRQVENQYATLSREQVLSFPPVVQRLLGFGIYRFELGHTYNVSPIEYYQRELMKP